MIKVVVHRHRMEESNPWLDALADGIALHRGVKVEREPHGAHVPCDLAVVYGHRHDAIIAGQRAAGRHYLVMEMGYAGDRSAWQSLRFDGLNGRGWCPPAQDGGERWRRLFGHLARPWRAPEGDHVLLIGQVRGDAAVRHVDLPAWYVDAAARIRRAHNQPCRFRPHPHIQACNDRVASVGVARGSLEEALDGAACVVTFNSNVGVVAAIRGVPVVVEDEGGMARPVAGHRVGEVMMANRSTWFADLAYSQWDQDEMRSGEAWEHLRMAFT